MKCNKKQANAIPATASFSLNERGFSIEPIGDPKIINSLNSDFEALEFYNFFLNFVNYNRLDCTNPQDVAETPTSIRAQSITCCLLIDLRQKNRLLENLIAERNHRTNQVILRFVLP